MKRFKQLMIDYDRGQPDAFVIQAEQQRASEKVQRRSLVIIIALILLVWLMFANLELVITARGEITEAHDIEKIQHLEGGIVAKIFVVEGQKVYKGQPLAVIKSFDTHSQLSITQGEIQDAEMEMERLMALIEQRNIQLEHVNPNNERRVFNEKSWQIEKKKNASQDRSTMFEIRQAKTVLASMKLRLKSSVKQGALMQEKLDIKEQLYKEEIASYLEVIGIRIESMNMYRELQNLEEGIMQKEIELYSLEHRLVNERNIRNAQYMDKYTETKKKHLLKVSSLPAAADKVDRLTIFSPIDGVIDKLNYNYLSAVISPGDSFAEIAPLQDKLLAEVKLMPKDIGHVEVGQKVRVKIDTFDFTKYGWIDGRVESISRYTQEEEKEKYYQAKILLNTLSVEKSGVKYDVLPSMEVTADIITGERKVVEYAVKPVVQMLEGAFNER